MGHDEVFRMTRDEVIAKLRGATNLKRALEAQKIVVEWLREHPDDRQIRDEAEGLGMYIAAQKLLKSQEAA